MNLTTTKALVIIVMMLAAFIICLGAINDNILSHSGRQTYNMKAAGETLIFIPVTDTTVEQSKVNDREIVAGGRYLPKSLMTFNQNPKLLIWMLLFAVVTTISVGLVFPFGNDRAMRSFARQPCYRYQ